MLQNRFLAICQFAVWDIADLGDRDEMMVKGDAIAFSPNTIALSPDTIQLQGDALI